MCFLRRPQKLTKSSPSIWHLLHNFKWTVKISSIFVAFLENITYLIWWPYFESSLSPSIAVWCCDSSTSSVCPIGWLLASIPSSLESQELISWSFLANCSLSDAMAVHSLLRDKTRCCKYEKGNEHTWKCFCSRIYEETTQFLLYQES